ncbi:MAG TPA: DUF120 domain-containing protein [Candidatus Bilamarchaeaceae archaeon]|nr:DUF120 domain-containing protein [Candidatus Bilamarchaeaceae archaeon]
MNKILLFLFKEGAAQQPVRLSTTQLGKRLSMSQQNASRCLIELEKEGKIERSEKGIRLTGIAMEDLRHLYHDLKSVFEGAAILKGKIVAGLREGAYYLSLPGYRKPLKEALGFEPFPGTLNLKLNGNPALPSKESGIFIPGFEWKNRSFGGLHAYPCNIEGIPGALLRPVRTHHGPGIAELIAPVSLKKKLRKKEGDWVEVKL